MKKFPSGQWVLLVLILCSFGLFMGGHPQAGSTFGTCAILWAVIGGASE